MLLTAPALALLTLALLDEAVPAVAPPAAAPASPAPSEAMRRAQAVVSEAFADGAAPVAVAPPPVVVPGASTPWALVLPGLVLLALAGVAYRGRRGPARSSRGIRLLETASLGANRSLVVAEVLGERLVLGVSEAGIQVLSARGGEAEGFEAALSGQVRAAPLEGEDEQLRAKLARLVEA